jgi:hypothetical protein
VEKELPPRIGTFGLTGALRNLIHRSLPAALGLFQGLQRAGPAFPDMGASGLFYVGFRTSRARDLGHISTNYRTQNEMFMLTAFNHR